MKDERKTKSVFSRMNILYNSLFPLNCLFYAAPVNYDFYGIENDMGNRYDKKLRSVLYCIH